VEDVRNLTREEAVLIYQHEFWDKLHIGKIRDQRIAETYFFAVVNMGPRFPSLYLQECLRELGNPLLMDGIVGPDVRAQLNALSVEEATIVLTKFLDRLRTRYELLAKVSPEYADDLASWKARLGA
jgi:lysozyme family protein